MKLNLAKGDTHIPIPYAKKPRAYSKPSRFFFFYMEGRASGISAAVWINWVSILGRCSICITSVLICECVYYPHLIDSDVVVVQPINANTSIVRNYVNRSANEKSCIGRMIFVFLLHSNQTPCNSKGKVIKCSPCGRVETKAHSQIPVGDFAVLVSRWHFHAVWNTGRYRNGKQHTYVARNVCLRKVFLVGQSDVYYCCSGANWSLAIPRVWYTRPPALDSYSHVPRVKNIEM